MVKLILAISILLNVIWFPATVAAKLWFFKWAVIWWFAVGAGTTGACLLYYKPLRDRSELTYCFILAISGPTLLIEIIKEKFE
ncbi:MAG: hypothetical protein HY226_00755 [Candidatus Vogelbacteria bacterium]|nr:hypothetical protein [Candidatus Vogelbacteria bacterium]